MSEEFINCQFCKRKYKTQVKFEKHMKETHTTENPEQTKPEKQSNPKPKKPEPVSLLHIENVVLKQTNQDLQCELQRMAILLASNK